MVFEKTGITDGIYTVKRAHQISNCKKQPLYLLFVDLTAAFDHIPWLNQTPISWGWKCKVIRYFREFVSENHPWHTKRLYLTTFFVSSGVRQGGPESPPLFNLFIDFVMSLFMSKCRNDGSIKFFAHQSMPERYLENNDWECGTRIRKLWDFLLYCGLAMRTILFCSCWMFICYRKQLLFLTKFLLASVFASMNSRLKRLY